MRGDLLSGGVPKKLLFRDGQWTLEVVRQVAVERNVYRPHTQHLQGTDAILTYLKRSAQFQALADTATNLLSRRDAESQSYEVVNGEWTQSILAPSYIEELKRQHRVAAQRSQGVRLLEVRAECVRLRAVNATLLRRVEALEQRLDSVFSVVEELKARKPVAMHPPVAPAVVHDAEPVSQPRANAVAAATSTPQLAKLRLPKASDLVRCIEQLIGSDTTAHEAQEQLDPAAEKKLFVSVLLEDNDQVVGAILMDVVSTVFLGGTLLMVPEAELASQVSMVKPSEDSIAASSEVCNALSGSINNVADNVPVRTKYLEEFKADDLPWLAAAAVRMTLQDSFGGRIMIACR